MTASMILAQTPGHMVAEVIAEYVKIEAPRFASLTYRNEAGELATYTLMLGLDSKRAYARDLALVSAYLNRANLTPIEVIAATEIRDSLAESLTKGIGNNSRYVHSKANADTYVEIFPGIKVNKSDNPEDRGTVYLMAYRHRKVVHEKGTYKEVKSSEKTLTKNRIKRELHLRTERIRQFKVKCSARCAMNGKVMVLTAE